MTSVLHNPFQQIHDLVLRVEQHMLNLVDRFLRLEARMTVAEPAGAHDVLKPDYAYSPKQAARFLGVKTATYNKIDRVLIPRFGDGRARGIDIMAYRGDVSREAAEAYKAQKIIDVTGTDDPGILLSRNGVMTMSRVSPVANA